MAEAAADAIIGIHSQADTPRREMDKFHDARRKGARKRFAGARKVAAVSLVSAFTFALGACGGPESVFVLGAGLANFIHTDRVPVDYLAEYASGQECNLLKSIEDGGPLCRNSFNPTVVEPPLYCYRTLGEPSCYVSPDPHKTGAQTIR